MPIITQTLNINNVRTTIAKSINLHTIRKFAEYSLKHVRQRQCLLLPFSRYCCPKVRLVLQPAQRGTGSERVKVCPSKMRKTFITQVNFIRSFIYVKFLLVKNKFYFSYFATLHCIKAEYFHITLIITRLTVPLKAANQQAGNSRITL